MFARGCWRRATPRHTVPTSYKGDASYYALLVGGRELTDSVWTYREHHDAVAAIAGHVAFYPDRVDVSAES